MKKLLLFLAISISCQAQLGNVVMKHFPGVPSGRCQKNQQATNDATGALYNCDPATFMWVTAGTGSGTVSVKSSGSLTDTAFVTGNGTTVIQTPSATSTLDSSGNASFAGKVTAASDGTHAGAAEVVGNTTAPSLDSNTFSLIGPNSASFTAWGIQMASAENGSAGILHVGAAFSHVSQGTVSALVAADLPANTNRRGIAFSIGDPAGSALSAASTTTAYVTVPYACTISAYNLVIPSGTITVKFWKKATGTAIPTSSDSINTSGVGIATGTAIHSATVSDFTTTTVTANDIMAMNVTVVATAPYVQGVLECDQ